MPYTVSIGGEDPPPPRIRTMTISHRAPSTTLTIMPVTRKARSRIGRFPMKASVIDGPREVACMTCPAIFVQFENGHSRWIAEHGDKDFLILRSKAQAAETSAEIGKRNRRLMFGDNDEAFPSADEWRRITD